MCKDNKNEFDQKIYDVESKIEKYVNWILPFFLGIGIYILLYVSSNFAEEIFSWQMPAYLVLVTGIVIWVVRAYLNKFARNPSPSTLELKQFIIAFVIATSIYMLCYLGLKTALIELANQNDSIDIRHLSLSAAQYSIMSLIVVGAQFLMIGAKAWSENQIREERLIKENTEAKLQNLKMQLSPHFLFNSFNTLESLIHQSPKEASEFLHELSNLYRSILKYGEETIILLSEELRIIRHFSALMQTRFGSNFHCEINISETLMVSHYVPPLSLQLLLENAVKHNCIDSNNTLKCKIFVDGDYIKVSNKINLRNQENDRKGLGLKNLVERYKYLSDLPVIIEEKGGNFEVGIPILDLEFLST